MKTQEATTKKFVKHTIPYAETGMFGKLAIDYISENQNLKSFYNRFPSISAFEEQLKEKSKNYHHREVLVSVLEKQYASAKIKNESIDLLKSENSFTITTGHQVCLFTGPLYFFYKIISTINTCRILKQKYPSQNFIPIFWMATEDHDFEEANHFFLPSGKIEWESGQGGAVGRMQTIAMDEVLEELKEKLGIGFTSGTLVEMFKKAYVKHTHIADATRALVHDLFGKYGLIVIDADDKELKKLAVPCFEKELIDHKSFEAVLATNKRLTHAGYNLQVQPHEINLFYLEDELRERIEKNEDGAYRVVRTGKTFTQDELIDELHKHPERFSPNVILRPVYQEIILPNLAYIGGGGELAYWLQLKDVFGAYHIPFPVLMLRNSVMVVPESIRQNLNQLGIKVRDIFHDHQLLEDKLVLEESAEKLTLKEEHKQLEELFKTIENRLRDIDKGLEKSVKSAYVKAQRIFESLEKKMMRSERRKHDILINRLQKVFDALMPRNGLQERNMNFAPIYLEFGDGLIDQLIEAIHPFEFEFTILEIESA